ncbi:MAG: single-stranded DNA-binding protein [Chloroflexota bacterium]|nr:single-stranded DNA-binding protein [Chloroflexota bacterium]
MKPIKGTVNYVEIIGWLGNDPEQRFTPSGVAIAEFSVATKRLGSRNEDGSWTYDTDWLDVVAWDQLAETVGANLRKGSRVRVTGSLRTDTWEDRDGNKRKRVNVRAEDVIFLDARSSLDDATMGEASA